MLKKRSLKTKVLSILLAVAMVVALLPVDMVQIPTFAAGDEYKAVEVEGKKIYFYGAETVEEATETQDQSAYEISYTGAEETALAMYVGGTEATVEEADVTLEADKVIISKSWLEQQDKWIAVKCTVNSVIPAEEPLPELDVKVTAYDGKYDEEEHDAVEVEISNKTDKDVISYSVNGEDWVDENDKPKIKVPGTQKIIVRVEREGYQTYISDEVTAKVENGEIDATVTPLNVTYNPNDASAKEAVTVTVKGNDVFVKEYSLDGGNSWQEEVPTIELPGEKEVTVKITSEYYNEYEKTVTAKMAPATIEGITVHAYSGVYDGVAHNVVTGIDGLKTGDLVTYSEDDGVTWVKEDEMPQITNAGEKKFLVRIKRVGHDDYITIPAMIAEIKKANIEGVVVKKYNEDGTKIYDSKEHKAIESVTGYNENTDTVTYSIDGNTWKDDSSELIIKDVKEYKYYVKVVRDANYEELIIPVEITIGKAAQSLDLSFSPEMENGQILYKDNNKITCTATRPEDAKSEISFSLESTNNIAIITQNEENKNEATIEFSAVGTVKVTVFAEEDGNYNKAEKTEEFTIVYATLPEEAKYVISEPSHEDDKYDWYSSLDENNIYTIKAPEGWLVRANSNAVDHSEEWASSVEVKEEGIYEDYKVAFMKEGTTEITSLIDVPDFAVDATNPKIDRFTFSDVKTTDEDPLSKIANFLTFGLFSNEAVQIVVEASDTPESDTAKSSGIKAIKLYKYTTAGDLIAEVPVKNADLANGKATFEIEPYFEGTIWAEVIDNVGRTSAVISEDGKTPIHVMATTTNSNVGTTEGYVMLETDKPEVTEIADTPLTEDVRKEIVDGKSIYSGDISFSFTTKDINSEELHGSGLSKTYIQIAGKDNYEESHSDYENQDINQYDYKVTTENKIAKDDGSYEVNVEVTDNAGNVTPKSATVYVDRTYPIITNFEFSLDESIDVESKSGAFDAVVSTDYGFYFRKDVVVTISADDIKADNEIASGLKSITYKTVDIDGTVVTEEIPVEEGKNSVSIIINKNFKGQIYAFATDKVGNMPMNAIAPVTYDKAIDTEGFVHPNGSVVEKADKHKETSSITFTMPKASGKQDDTYKYKYSGEAAADGKMDYNTTSLVPLYSSDIKVGVKVTDSYSGIREVKWTVMEGETSTEQKITIDNTGKMNGDTSGWNAKKEEGSNLVTSIENTGISISGNYNDMVILVELTDRAGNKSYDYYVFGIDKTAPIINVSYDNNNGDSKAKDGSAYFKAKRVSTITVTERNFNEDVVTEKITRDTKNNPVYLSWKKVKGTGNGDDTKHIATIKYDEDGDYTFSISLKDRAKNANKTVDYGKSVAPKKFTIDLTMPIVKVSYDNNSAQNGKYFKAERTATITVTEHNFTSTRVTYDRTARKDGSRISLPTVSEWKKNGDVYTATIKYAADGDYTFDVTVNDLAGNKNKDVDYGTSVAAKDFTVDTTITKPVITGVEDGHSYKGDVIPTIKFADINFATREIKLTRTRKDEKNVDVTDELISSVSMGSHGGTIVSDNFKKEQNIDGIYTLSLKMTDKAGNESDESITFTVNRFGSVYVFNDYLIGLQDTYVQKIDGNIVITEYNPNKLVANSLKIQVTLDGAPIEDLVYTVNPIVNDKVKIGSSGWYQYEYVIEASNFSKDGVYKLSVSSEDEVGNKPETANYEECDVLFRVDTTPAEITNISGLEKAIVNADKLDINFEVFDAIGLKAITVYRDGEIFATFDSFEDLVNFKGAFELSEGSNQKIEIVVEDLAGNKLSTSSEEFKPEYEFNDEVTISTNIFVRWFANKWLFWGSIVAIILIAGGIFFIILKRKKEDEDETQQAAE